jgi:hypothetical protein
MDCPAISSYKIAKIQSNNIAESVKRQLEEYVSRDDIYEQQESPLGKAMNQAVDMFKATKVDIKLIEPEFVRPDIYTWIVRLSPPTVLELQL